MMKLLQLGASLLSWSLCATATILENGHERLNPWPGQTQSIALDESWKSYGPDVSQISYKGRWDSQHISCMIFIFFFSVSDYSFICSMLIDI